MTSAETKEKKSQGPTVEVALLRASEDNPRKAKEVEQEVQSLADSMKEVGLLQPILVRPIVEPEGGTVFEIVCGHRRARAALLLGWDKIPATVVEMDEDKIDSARVIENVQRRDLAPLEEAEYYSYLTTKHNLHVPDLAAKLGKTRAHVARRLALLTLIGPLKLKLAAGELPVGMALKVAPFQPDQQKQVIGYAFRGGELSCTEADLDRWLSETFLLDLTKVLWDLDDPKFPSAGSCSACPKRAGGKQDLFPGMKGDTCTDPKCFQKKFDTTISSLLKEQPEMVKLSSSYGYYGEKKPKDVLKQGEFRGVTKGAATCEHLKNGIWIDGVNRGKIEMICSGSKCSVHDPYAGERESGRKTDAKLRFEQKVVKEARRTTYAEFLKKVSGPVGPEDLRLVLSSSFSRLWHEAQKEVFRAFKWEPKKEKYGMGNYGSVFEQKIGLATVDDLRRFALAIALAGDVGTNSKAEDLKKVAAVHGVRMVEIEKAVRDRLTKKPKVKKAPGKPQVGSPVGKKKSAKKADGELPGLDETRPAVGGSGQKATRKSSPKAVPVGSEKEAT